MGFVFTGPKSSQKKDVVTPVVKPQVVEVAKSKPSFWDATKSVLNPISGWNLYKGISGKVTNSLSNIQKDLAPPVIDPTLHWNLYNKGKVNELKNLENNGVVVPKLLSPPPSVSPFTPEEEDYYSNKVLNDMTKDRVIKEDRENSVTQTGAWERKDDEYYNALSKDRLEETKQMVRDRTIKNISNDILDIYGLGGYSVDKKLVENLQKGLLEIVDTDSLTPKDISDTYHFPKLVKRTDVSDPDYLNVFAQRAKEEFTSGLLKSGVEPETTGEEIAATLGNLAGMVSSLMLTGKALHGAALLTKTGQTFQKTAPYLFELSKSVGSFNVHGQLRPELVGDWNARMNTAFMDTEMALFFAASGAMFPGKLGIPVTGGVFGGLSALNGESKEVIITNALAGGLLHGMGFMKAKTGKQLLDNTARKNLEKYSDIKLKSGYTNAEVNAAEALSTKKLLKKGNIEEIDSIRNSARHLKAVSPERRILVSPGDPYNNIRKTIREVGEELKALSNLKEKIKLEPATLGDMSKVTLPGKPKVVDSIRVVIGDMKTQPLHKDTISFLKSAEGKKTYLKRVESLKNAFNKASGKQRKIIGSHIDALVAVGRQLGYEGYRITDIKRRFTPTDLALREGEVATSIEGLAQRTIDSLKLEGETKTAEMSAIRKGVSDISEASGVNERTVAIEFLRRSMEIDTGRTAYKEYIKESDISGLLSIEPTKEVVVEIKPIVKTPEKLAKIEGFAQKPIEQITEGLKTQISGIKDAKERSKIIEDAIKKEYPKASVDQIKSIKSVIGKLLTGKKDFATAIKEVGETIIKPTQKELVKAVVKEKPKSIKEVSKETKILEPNVRRIFGVGEKEGTFERVEKGVYVLSKDGKDMAYIHPGDALEILPKLAKDKFKADMIFLDIPYKTPAVVGGSRGVKYGLIEPSQFKIVVDNLLKMTRTKDTPVLYMYSNAVSGKAEMSKFNNILLENFKPIARGSYSKLTKAGKLFGFPTPSGWKPLAPEGIILVSVSGKLDPAIESIKDSNLNFAFNRPKGWQSEKPKEMLEKMIKMTTKEGDMVFDPFAGSGVTGEQAIKAGRRTRLIEKSEEAVKEHIKPRIKKALEEVSVTRELAKEEIKEVEQVLRKSKGLSADDIIKQNPDINLKRDVPIRDIYGKKQVIPEGEALTPYELKGNKILLQDGKTYIVSKNQYENIKGQSIKGEAKEFAPELKGTKDVILGNNFTTPKKGKPMIGDGPSKFSEYQLPGGKNYKEILIQASVKPIKITELRDNMSIVPLTEPIQKKDYPGAKYKVVMNDGYRVIGAGKTKELAKQDALKNMSVHATEKVPTFESPHFQEKGILSWLRTNVRKYKNKAVLFIEEIQSDWASEGRKKGFIKEDELILIDNIEKYLANKDKELGKKLKKEFPEWSSQYEKFDDFLKNKKAFLSGIDKIPSNKLLKNWQELAVKRALKEAVDTNAEYLAWINGNQTTARYNLATQVDSVKWEKVITPSGKDIGKQITVNAKRGRDINLHIDKTGKIINTSMDNAMNKNIDEVLGKGLADKIMSKKSGKLSGEGLEFGGEWAENLYDKQIPNIVKDITGVRPEVIDMKLPIQKISQWDDMRGGILHKEDLKVGAEITKDLRETSWIITDVLGNGKFKAVSRDNGELFKIIYKNKFKELGGTVDGLLEFYFKPGREVPAYGGTTDVVVKYTPSIGNKPWEVEVREKGHTGTRTHSTFPSTKNVFDVVIEEGKINWKKLSPELKDEKVSFDIIGKQSKGQQAIKITPEIQALVKGEVPPMKKPSGVSPLAEKLEPKVQPSVSKLTAEAVGEIEAAVLKPKASIVKFHEKDKRNILTTQGDYTNSFWLLKEEYIPTKLKERMTPLEDKKQDVSSVWDRAREGNLAPVSDITGYFEYKGEIGYIIKNVKGKNIGISKGYYDYLKKNIKDFNLKATENTKPLIIYSGNKEAGLLMPVIVEDAKIIKFKTKLETKPPTKIELAEADQFTEIPHKGKLYTGIDPGVGVFWDETLKPLGKATAENIKDASEGIVNLFAPAAKSKEAGLTATVIRKRLSKFQRQKDMGAKISKEVSKWWDKNTDKIRNEFLDSVEIGKLNKYIKETAKPEERKVLQSLMDQYRERLEKTHEISKEVNDQIGYIMNYMPHIWKNTKKASKIFGDWQMVIGKEKFAKKRLIDFIKKGRELGLELVTNNPEDLVLMREISAWQAKSQLDVVNELSDLGLLKSPKEGSKLAGYKQLRTTYGTYSMPEDVARVINNWLKPRLWADPGLKGKAFRSAMKLKNMTVAGKLALSAFHIVETGVSNLASQSMIASRKLGRGDIRGFFDEALKTFTTIPKDVGIPFVMKGRGGEIIEAWFNEPKYEWQKEAIDLMHRAGGRPLMSSEWRVNAIRGFKQSVRKGNYITALGRSFPALLETMAIPMFDYWVPRMKVASFNNLSKDYIMRHPEISGTKLDMELGKIWDSVDNRFGQMVYDNLFWNSWLRDMGTLNTLSLGWQLGTVREFGGAAFIDTPRVVKELALKMTKDPNLKVEMTDRMLYSMMYTMWFGMLGSLLGYGMTGEKPKKVLDFFYPKTGEKNADGTDARLQMPTMLKEMFRAEKIFSKYGLTKGVVRIVKHKQAPIWNSLIELWGNKDFYGAEIHNPTDPLTKQALDISKFLITENFEPISVSEWMKMKEKDETNPLVFAGFTAAPSYITQTKLAAEIARIYEKRFGGGTISKTEEHKRQEKTKIRNKFRKNELTRDDVKTAIETGILTERGLNEFFRRAALPSDVRLFAALNAEDQNAVLLNMKMNMDELGRYLPEAKKEVKEKWGMITE